MGFLDDIEHPDGCICCWIMGFGVDEEHPNEWAEQILLREEDCEFHGTKARAQGQVQQAGGDDGGGEQA